MIVLIGIFSGITLGLVLFALTQIGGSEPAPAPEETVLMQEVPAPPTVAPTEPTVPAQTEAEETVSQIPEETVSPAPTVSPLSDREPQSEPAEKPQSSQVSFRTAEATVYATASCNVRSGPSVKDDAIGKLKKGQAVKRLAIGDNGWVRIHFENWEAYVYGEYLSEKAPADHQPSDNTVSYEKVSEIVYSTASVNVRSGPGKNYKAIGYLMEGDSTKRIGIGDNGWSKIIYEQKEAYVCSEYLTTQVPSTKPSAPKETVPSENPQQPEPTQPSPKPTEPAAQEDTYRTVDETVKATDSIHIRSGPGKNYKAIGYLQPGHSIRRVAIGDNGWSKVIYEDQIAYASSQYLTAIHQEASNPQETVPVRKPQEEVPQYPSDNQEPDYEKVAEMVYATELVNVRQKPDTGSKSLGKLECGESVQRIGIGNNGWSKVVYREAVAYVKSDYITTEEPVAPDFGETTTPGFPTPNSPFIYQYWAEEGRLPYAMFVPVSAGDTPLPLIISLHGASEVGKNREFLESRFLTQVFREWEYTGLSEINAYVVCPHLTGEGHPQSWNRKESADQLFDLISTILENFPIDENRIILEGHSMGAQGALYMAADQRADFSAVVVLDAYDPGVDIGKIDAVVRGYTSDFEKYPESRHYYDYMKKAFGDTFQKENWFVIKDASHDSLPRAIFTMDRDHDKQSDLITWMLAQ